MIEILNPTNPATSTTSRPSDAGRSATTSARPSTTPCSTDGHTTTRFADGDLLTLDLAVSKDGVAADSAISLLVGESKPPESVAMINATERALYAGIAAAGPGAEILTLPKQVQP